MNDFDKGLIVGMAHNVVVERIVKEYFVTRKFAMTMDCIVLDENEQEVSNVSTMYTRNAIAARAVMFVNNALDTFYGTFYDLDGNEFTGVFKTYYSYSSDVNSIWAHDILGYSPVVYISSDGTQLSKNDFNLPDDATQINYTKPSDDDMVAGDDSATTVLHTYYLNETDETITINKVLIIGQVYDGTSLVPVMMFEELLSAPITLNAGEYFYRDYRFRLAF